MNKLFSAKSVSYIIDGKKARGSRVILVATFLVSALAVGGLLVALVALRGDIEALVGNLARLLPVGYAFAAGMVASVNPCGVLMLPTYFLHQLRTDGRNPPAARRLLKGLLIASIVTSGFLVVFTITGGVISIGGQWLIKVFPYAGLLIGATMAVLGLWLLISRRTLGIPAAEHITVAPKRNLGNAFVFGVAYAAGSLSCTLPIFLVVVGGALASTDTVSAFGQFVGYAAGMSTLIFAVSIGAALFRRMVFTWLRSLRPYIHRISAMFLLGAGAYLIYYWIFQAGLA